MIRLAGLLARHAARIWLTAPLRAADRVQLWLTTDLRWMPTRHPGTAREDNR